MGEVLPCNCEKSGNSTHIMCVCKKILWMRLRAFGMDVELEKKSAVRVKWACRSIRVSELKWKRITCTFLRRTTYNAIFCTIAKMCCLDLSPDACAVSYQSQGLRSIDVNGIQRQHFNESGLYLTSTSWPYLPAMQSKAFWNRSLRAAPSFVSRWRRMSNSSHRSNQSFGCRKTVQFMACYAGGSDFASWPAGHMPCDTLMTWILSGLHSSTLPR